MDKQQKKLEFLVSDTQFNAWIFANCFISYKRCLQLLKLLKICCSRLFIFIKVCNLFVTNIDERKVRVVKNARSY